MFGTCLRHPRGPAGTTRRSGQPGRDWRVVRRSAYRVLFPDPFSDTDRQQITPDGGSCGKLQAPPASGVLCQSEALAGVPMVGPMVHSATLTAALVGNSGGQPA